MGKYTWFSSQLLSNGERMTRFYSYHKADNKFKEFIWFRGTLSPHYKHLYGFWTMFKGLFYNLVSVYLKSIKLGQIKTLNVIWWWSQIIDWLVVESDYRLVKIETRPSSLWNSGMANTNTIVVQQVTQMWLRNLVKIFETRKKMVASKSNKRSGTVKCYRVIHFWSRLEIISENQFSYLRGRSTVTQLSPQLMTRQSQETVQ